MSRPHAVLGAAAMLWLAACAATRVPPPAAQPPPAIALDASYDWHVLLTAPFGTLLKDLPFAVHEVLLFQDESHNPSPGEDAECYATDAQPPRFIDRMPDEYLLCFKHDRLSRVVAAVRLPQSDAAKVFADVCGSWMKTAVARPGAAPAAAAPPPSGETCDGTDGSSSYSGRLEKGSEQQDSDDALLSVTLNAAEPD